jgi:hypothetical protein
LTETEKIDNIEGWKTTIEVGEVLNVSPITLRVYRNQNKDQFEGMVTRSKIEREGKVREHLLWSPEAIKILMLNVSNSQTDQWKDEVVNEVVEKGMVVTDSVKALRNPENRLQLIKLQSQQIIAMVDEMEDIKSDVKLLQEKAKNVFVIPTTRKFLRDEVHRVALEYFNGDHYEVWIPLRNKYNISSYHELTEEQAQLELRLLRKEYPSINKEV